MGPVASVITHPAVALGLAPHFRNPPLGPRVWLLGALCTVIPDIDSLGFWWGIPYGDPLGHRGFTHSMTFALLLAGLICALGRRWLGGFSWSLVMYLALCGISHGVYDALTTGGLGVAFFSPFSNRRYFFPWRPIVVSPISVTGFFNSRALQVLASELFWVVLPWTLIGVLGIRRRRRP
jgi:inner membrane protein